MNNSATGVASASGHSSLTSTGSACSKHKHTAKSVNQTSNGNNSIDQQALNPALVSNVVDCASCCDRIQCYTTSSKGQADKKASSTHHSKSHQATTTTTSSTTNHQDANNNHLNKTGSTNPAALDVVTSGSVGQQQTSVSKVSKSPSHPHSSAGSASSTAKPQRNPSTSNSHSHHHHSKSSTAGQTAQTVPSKQHPHITDPQSVPNLEQLQQEQALLKQHQKQKHQKAANSSNQTEHHHRHSSHQSSHHSTSHSHHHHHSHHKTSSAARHSPDSNLGKQQSVKPQETTVDGSGTPTASGQHCHQPPSNKMPLVKGKESKEKTGEQFDRKYTLCTRLLIRIYYYRKILIDN